jgi:GTP-binding protein
MLPVIALVGRPNVGKSTLFNVLTGTRDALVADIPGLTRDRKYGYGRNASTPYLVVDTGGLVAEADSMEELMAKQTLRAIEEADRVLFWSTRAKAPLMPIGTCTSPAQARQSHRR